MFFFYFINRVFCGLLEKNYKKSKKYRALWAFLIGVGMEVFHLLMAFIYFAARQGASYSWDLISEISLPMILANAFGAFIITFTLDVVHAYKKSEAHKKQISVELNVANSIQNDMLPAIFPDFPGREEFSLSAKMLPAKEVGGDFYDFFFVDDDHFAILVGDVSGKGVPAALFMVISKTILKNNAQSGLTPCQVLTKANKELCEGNKENMFVTVWLGFYEISTGKLTYANGGHNPPVIIDSQGKCEYLKNVSGFILAGMPKMNYKEFTTYLKPGEKILLYTDGVTEAMNIEHKAYGEQHLLDVLTKEVPSSSPKEDVLDIEKSIDEFRGKAEQSDDITMLLLGVNELTKIKTLEVKKENFDVLSGFMEDVLRADKVPESTITKMDIVLDELYSNVVNYSKSQQVTVLLVVDKGKIKLVLKYQGVLFDITKTSDPDITLKAEERQIGGLGLMIVKKSVDTLEYKVENGDTNVVTVYKKY